MNENRCEKCNQSSVMYQEMDGSFVCGHLLSDQIINRYPGFRETLTLSLERAERMKTINQERRESNQLLMF